MQETPTVRALAHRLMATHDTIRHATLDVIAETASYSAIVAHYDQRDPGSTTLTADGAHLVALRVIAIREERCAMLRRVHEMV